MRPKPIVVGVDNSPESRRAMAAAWNIADAAGAELVAVHAVPDLWLAGNLDNDPIVLPEVREALTRASRTQIERVLDDVLPRGAPRRLEVLAGPAGFAIADVARRWHAELVVLGGKHHGVLGRGLGRSTARYLVRTLDVPMLVIGHRSDSLNRVLAAVDLSSAAIPTIKKAERFTKLVGGRLRILHVIEPLRLTHVPLDTRDEVGFERHSREAFAHLTAMLAPLVPKDEVVRIGPAVQAIVEEAAAWQADLLVVGSHGKGWVDRFLIGSTTEGVLNLLPASVMIVPTGVKATRAYERSQRKEHAHVP